MRREVPVLASHRRTVPAKLRLVTNWPSADSATPKAPPVWPCSVARGCPVSASQTRAVHSALPVATGLAGWALPVAQVAPLYDLHRALGVALLLMLLWKQVIIRRSLRRRWGRDGSTVWGILAGTALLIALAIGLGWTLRLISFDT